MNAFTAASPKQRLTRSSWSRKVFSFFWGAPLLIWQGAFFFAPLVFLVVLDLLERAKFPRSARRDAKELDQDPNDGLCVERLSAIRCALRLLFADHERSRLSLCLFCRLPALDAGSAVCDLFAYCPLLHLLPRPSLHVANDAWPTWRGEQSSRFGWNACADHDRQFFRRHGRLCDADVTARLPASCAEPFVCGQAARRGRA